MKMKLVSYCHGAAVLRRHAAFTLIEMIVAMAIASLMIFLINRIFMDTTNAVSRGMGISQIIGESRAAMNILAADTSAIIPTYVMPIVPPAATAPLDGGHLYIGFKTYQDVQFPHLGREKYADLERGRTRDVQSDMLMMVVTVRDGKPSMTPADVGTYTTRDNLADKALLWYGHVGRLEPGSPDTIREGDPGREPPVNDGYKDGHHWVVGRHLMFLAGNTVASMRTELPDAVNHRMWANAPVQTGLAATWQRYQAVTDVLGFTLNANDHTGLNYWLGPIPTPLSNDDYLEFVARMAYGANRLVTAVDVPYPFPPLRVAQTHTAFINRCSDFQVSFAGDFDTTAGIDFDSSGVKWYGYPPNDPDAPYNAGYDSTKPALYSPQRLIDASVPGVIYGNVAGLTSPNRQIDQAIVFRHDADIAHWPHLIRIRYRLHDERGEVESTNNSGEREQGMWFEHLIQVQ